MKWKLYWAGLCTLMFSVSCMSNRCRYPAKSRTWVLIKSAVDTAMAGGIAWLCPPVLIGLIVLRAMERVSPNPAIRMSLSILLSVGLSALSAWFLEALLLLGTIACDQLSSVFLAKRQLIKSQEWALPRAA